MNNKALKVALIIANSMFSVLYIFTIYRRTHSTTTKDVNDVNNA